MNGGRSVRVVGPGRAGGSLAGALEAVGWEVRPALGSGDDLGPAARDVDLVVIATPDAAIAEVAAAIDPVPATVVAHLAGSLGLSVLGDHERRAALHPLVSLPSAEIGAERLRDEAWLAVAGDPLIGEVVADLGARSFTVAEEDRAVYHAAACVAANHLVALMGQVERLAESVDVPFEAYLDLARDTFDNTAALGPAAALTGPAARGDEITISRHLAALPPGEHPTYDALAAEARRLATGA